MTDKEWSGADMVNHPPHYTAFPGIEVIDLTQHLMCNPANTVKYAARAGLKGGKDKQIEDMKKARWYADKEVERLGGKSWRVTLEDNGLLEE